MDPESKNIQKAFLDRLDRFPARSDMVVLSADDPNAPKIGFRVEERIGIGVCNLRGLDRLMINR